MNFKTTFILVVTLLVVAGVVFFTRDTGDDKDKTEKDAKARLVDIKPEDVTRVVVTPAQGPRTVFVRDAREPAEWRLAEPVAARAETFEVDQLVRDLTGLQSRGQVEASQRAS